MVQQSLCEGLCGIRKEGSGRIHLQACMHAVCGMLLELSPGALAELLALYVEQAVGFQHSQTPETGDIPAWQGGVWPLGDDHGHC